MIEYLFTWRHTVHLFVKVIWTDTSTVTDNAITCGLCNEVGIIKVRSLLFRNIIFLELRKNYNSKYMETRYIKNGIACTCSLEKPWTRIFDVQYFPTRSLRREFSYPCFQLYYNFMSEWNVVCFSVYSNCKLHIVLISAIVGISSVSVGAPLCIPNTR
mgnify:CR=1 FL=1